MNKKLLKPKIIKNLQKLENKEKFLYSEAEDESLSTNAGANDDKGTNTNGKNADKDEGVNTDKNGEGANTNSKGDKKVSIDNKGEGIYDSDRSYNTKEED
ncbi:hypothetical protein RCL_jg2389.t1 [Rhizophagus clarus]|nr:hypothetical protein RCL_jg2389.t1 [Rhizophagus clarus]